MTELYAAGRIALASALPSTPGRLPAGQHRLISDAEVATIARWLGLGWERLDTDSLELPSGLITLHPTFYRLTHGGRDVVVEHDALIHPSELLPAAFRLLLDNQDLDGSLSNLLATQPIDVHDLDAEEGERELWLASHDSSPFRYSVPVTDAKDVADELAAAFVWLTEQQLIEVRPRVGHQASAHVINAGLGVLYMNAKSDGDLVCVGWRGREPAFLGAEITLTHAAAKRRLAPAPRI